MELTHEEMEWIQVRKTTIEQLAAGSFSGHIPMDDRATYESVAWKINGRSFPICWTCGGSIQQVGRLLKIKI